eukprot:NODE_6176_length_1698_cov_4.627626.p1 GENE.NODE_6176_length_1698_cov_4.627626~~NODE_6176_length_1698_cov_4.627626.p1  ORF type:complete len:390 (+),score=54.43 NODE_6176_length_1698_cov_4.627626:254-1423(+)
MCGKAKYTLMADSPKLALSWASAAHHYVHTAAWLIEASGVFYGGPQWDGNSPLARYAWFVTFVFIVEPVMEHMIGHDQSNPTAEQLIEGREKGLRFGGALYSFAPADAFGTYAYLRALRGQPAAADVVGLALMASVLNGGIGIPTAHELFHKAKTMPRLLPGRFMLAAIGFLYWEEEHVVGHHRWVATPTDPSTALQGESVYSFLPRTYRGTFVSSWRLHADRLQREGRVPSRAVFAMLNFGPTIGLMVFFAIAAAVPLHVVVSFFILQATFGTIYLEFFNYPTHYGLRRKLLEDGSCERPNPCHSWNCTHIVSNYLMRIVSRHSDHHSFPKREMQLLRAFKESPAHPMGTLGMFSLALCPPAFLFDHGPARRCRQCHWQAATGVAAPG